MVDLVDCIERFREILQQSIPGDIEIVFEAPQQEIAVKIDPDEFEIALLNLTLNARDAMPPGGRIMISLRTATLDENSGPGGLTGEYAIVTFSDTGSGIADDIRDRIFEPFFTTKKVDRGTGLGLSQVYGFAQQSRGAITVASRAGTGLSGDSMRASTWSTSSRTWSSRSRPASVSRRTRRRRSAGSGTRRMSPRSSRTCTMSAAL